MSESLRTQVQHTNDAKIAMRKLSAQQRRNLLTTIADGLRSATPHLLATNMRDIHAARESSLSEALIDRLTLTSARINALANAVSEVANAADLVGEIHSPETLANNLRIAKMRVPLGVIAMVYEARPNVTIEAAALCFKSGNVCVLRGGKEAIHSNHALAEIVVSALQKCSAPVAAMLFVEPSSRDNIIELAQMSGLVDVLIPRGGEGLIRTISEHARVPVIKHYKGVCHIFVEQSADLAMAESIVLNAKTQRPGVCNALETLLIDRDLGARVLPMLEKLLASSVELRVDDGVYEILPEELRIRVKRATTQDWDAEYLSLTLAVRTVNGFDEALSHIEKHGTQHTEAIVTDNEALAERFLREVDASLVLRNASTRFNDGGELGLGAEMGISTSKLHCYGAMGAKELMTDKRIAYGTGNIRK